MALKALAEQAGSSLREVRGIVEWIEAELLVEVGDPRRFAGEGGFARFNGTAPLPASRAEGDGAPPRHHLSRGGNRRVNACLNRIAITQLRCVPRARKIYDNARQRGHTKNEAMRILKRHLSDVVYRQMMRDLDTRLATQPPDHAQPLDIRASDVNDEVATAVATRRGSDLDGSAIPYVRPGAPGWRLAG
jgi:transposase